MKKTIYLCLIVALFCVSGCNFLEESSQDEVRPKTVDDLVQLMLGEGYMLNDDFFTYSDLLTDDVQQRYPEDQYAVEPNIEALNKYQTFYKWEPNMFDVAKELNVYNYNDWKYFYGKIKGCNVIMSYIDKVDGELAARENLRGQALGMRAYYYFMLVNMYGMPYNSGDPSKMLGVPLILEPQVTDSYPKRASVAEVYDRIIEDLNTAFPLLDKYGKNNLVYRVTDKFVHGLLSRVYLYMENWEESIKHSNYIIEKNPGLNILANAVTVDPWFGEVTIDLEKNMYVSGSTEMIWAYGVSSSTNKFGIYINPAFGVPAFGASEELLKLYKSDESGIDDLRSSLYFVRYFTNNYQITPLCGEKGNHSGSANNGMRSSESYLNRAEANIRLAIAGKNGSIEQALKDINKLRESRFNTADGGIYTPITISNPDELLQFCLDERRREFPFEHHRWFDLRRYGMPEIVHKLELTKGTFTQVVLPAKSKSYVLPIPQEVISRNPAIIQNPF